MIHQLLKVPNKVCLAFSGGVDSLAAAHFLKRGKKEVTLLHFNHGCQYSDFIENQCIDKAARLEMRLVTYKIQGEQSPGQSLEDFWRRKRYNWLRFTANELNQKLITCHHLDDAVETWIWSSIHGESKLIPYQDDTVIRPFLITEKQDFIEYAEKHGLNAVDDPYNREVHLIRNYMRVNMMHHVKYVNPGINTVIRKKYLNLVDNSKQS